MSEQERLRIIDLEMRRMCKCGHPLVTHLVSGTTRCWDVEHGKFSCDCPGFDVVEVAA